MDYIHSRCNLVCVSRIGFFNWFLVWVSSFELLVINTGVAGIREIKLAAELSKLQSITPFYCQ